MSGLLITNIIITVLIYISTLFSGLIKEDDDFGMIILTLTALVAFIVLVMIGVQFIRHFNGLLNKLGWGMLASLIIFISAAALISEDEFSMTNAIISLIEFWISSYVLYIQAELLAD